MSLIYLISLSVIEGNEKKTDIHTQRPCHIFYIVPKFVVVPCEAIKRNSVGFHFNHWFKRLYPCYGQLYGNNKPARNEASSTYIKEHDCWSSEKWNGCWSRDSKFLEYSVRCDAVPKNSREKKWWWLKVKRLEENKGDFHDRQDSSYMTPLKRSDWSSTQWQTPQYDWRSWLSWAHFLSFWKMLSFKVFWSCLLRIVSQQIFMGPFFRSFILRSENF